MIYCLCLFVDSCCYLISCTDFFLKYSTLSIYICLTTTDKRHISRHNRHRLHIRVQGQLGHHSHRLCDIIHIHHRLLPQAPIRLLHRRAQPRSLLSLARVGGRCKAAKYRGLRVSNVDLADGDVVFAAVEAGGFGDARDGVLCRCVYMEELALSFIEKNQGRKPTRNRVGSRSMGRNGAVVDDSAAAVGLHDFDRFLGAQEGTGQVDGKDGLPHVERNVFEFDRVGSSHSGCCF